MSEAREQKPNGTSAVWSAIMEEWRDTVQHAIDSANARMIAQSKKYEWEDKDLYNAKVIAYTLDDVCSSAYTDALAPSFDVEDE